MRIRIPMDEWIKAGAKNKSTFIPEGQREVNMIFATDVIFIDTELIPKPEPESVPEKVPLIEEPKEKVPDTSWSKKKLIKEAKKSGAYIKDMEDRKYTKQRILDAIKSS